MDDGMQWLVGTVLSAVISSVMTVGFLSALVTQLQIRIDHRNNGIKRVYAPGEHSRALKKQLAEARAIQLLTLSGYGFTHAYRRILTDCVARGGTVEYLLAQPGTAGLHLRGGRGDPEAAGGYPAGRRGKGRAAESGAG